MTSEPALAAEQLTTLASALESLPALNSPAAPSPDDRGDLGNAVFVGSGDSLAAALLAQRYGHRALSAGDIAWTGEIPPRCDTVVGVSQSGNTGATVLALRIARSAGLRTVALTTNGESALVKTADQVRLVPLPQVTEKIPAAGYVSLSAGVLGLCGRDLTGFGREVGGLLAAFAREHARTPLLWPETAPSSATVLTLPDLRSAGDFWMLKLIEAAGVATRAVALEESGHVDFFVGPQPHCTIDLIGRAGLDRHDRLAAALRANGHDIITVDAMRLFGDVAASASADGVDVALGAAGAAACHEAAIHWHRPPFRGGAVPMDAQHIKLGE
ncbi:hypothetical protein GCM10022224_036780 [Nonomuraea antimicrobica]|uniref:SIS domain-containing protein n=1 Tax=Nonomuraea antimicrobica TaxID=561173 RepID=A0ABP7BT31_9ACTN